MGPYTSMYYITHNDSQTVYATIVISIFTIYRSCIIKENETEWASVDFNALVCTAVTLVGDRKWILCTFLCVQTGEKIKMFLSMF